MGTGRVERGRESHEDGEEGDEEGVRMRRGGTEEGQKRGGGWGWG